MMVMASIILRVVVLNIINDYVLLCYGLIRCNLYTNFMSTFFEQHHGQTGHQGGRSGVCFPSINIYPTATRGGPIQFT